MPPAAPPPRHMSPEEFRRHGHAVIDWLAHYMETVETHPVLSQVAPGDIAGKLPTEAPLQGEPFEALLADMDEVVMPGITHWQSPNFFGFFPCNGSGPAILADLLSTGLGVQGMLWATSPAATEVETRMLDWTAGLLGLPERFLSSSAGGGVIEDSASSATLCALLAARERATAGQGNSQGLGACGQGLVAYSSTQTHSSIEKGLRIAGLGDDQLRKITVDHRFAMRPDALADAVTSDLAAGLRPFFVTATTGTTATGAFDPIDTIAEVCSKHGLWLHVDAAMFGTAATCPEHRWIQRGVERADSYCFNPHKWMLTSFDCSCFWVADRAALVSALTILPDYLRNEATASGKVIDYRDWQVPLGRRFRALKLWFVLRWYGVEGIQRLVRHHVALAQELAGWIEADERFEITAPHPLNLVCFRHRDGDDASRAVMDQVNAGGQAYLTHCELDGRLTLRLSVGQARTTADHVSAVWRLIGEAAEKV